MIKKHGLMPKRMHKCKTNGLGTKDNSHSARFSAKTNGYLKNIKKNCIKGKRQQMQNTVYICSLVLNVMEQMIQNSIPGAEGLFGREEKTSVGLPAAVM